jgi:hypothetical protein
MGAMVPAVNGPGWLTDACVERRWRLLDRRHRGDGEVVHGQWMMMKNPVTKIQPGLLAGVVEME